jgi:hypothetical protein
MSHPVTSDTCSLFLSDYDSILKITLCRRAGSICKSSAPLWAYRRSWLPALQIQTCTGRRISLRSGSLPIIRIECRSLIPAFRAVFVRRFIQWLIYQMQGANWLAVVATAVERLTINRGAPFFRLCVLCPGISGDGRFRHRTPGVGTSLRCSRLQTT